MNIFYLDHDPVLCAVYHVDKHVVKMILEYAQLLSTAHRVLDGISTAISLEGKTRKAWIIDNAKEQHLYKATHINHPSSLWARHNSSNYKWLFSLWHELLKEYTYRYNKIHASQRLYDFLKDAPNNIPEGEFIQPFLAMPDEFQSIDAIDSYRNYYKNGKVKLHTWKSRSIPLWISG